MAGKKGMRMTRQLDPDAAERIRQRVLSSGIANALIAHAKGEKELSNSQVTAGIALLRKVVPDLSAVEHSGAVETWSAMLQSLPTEAAQHKEDQAQSNHTPVVTH
jgi:hypothetical protein